MRITLISLHSEMLSIGPCSLSACLKHAGHEVRPIFSCQEMTIPGPGDGDILVTTPRRPLTIWWNSVEDDV